MCPRILTAHSIEEVQERADGRNIAVSGGILADTGLKDWQGLPVFNALREPEALADFVEERAFAPPLPCFAPDCCSLCGYSCRQLTELIARQEAKREDCLLWQAATELLINDTPPCPWCLLYRIFCATRSWGLYRNWRAIKNTAQ